MIKYVKIFNKAGENKAFKLNMENNDGIINECAKIQINQQKMITQLKDTLNDKNQIIEKVSIF